MVDVMWYPLIEYPLDTLLEKYLLAVYQRALYVFRLNFLKAARSAFDLV